MNNQSSSRLKEFVIEKAVCWDSQPLTAMLRGAPIRVGFELELRAVHGPTTYKPTPGCPHCGHLFKGLKELAEAVVPTEFRPSRYEVQPFDHSWHLYYSGPKGGSQTAGLKAGSKDSDPFIPEVVLKLQILHRKNYFEPIDDCERKCLKEIEAALKKLGARKGGRAPSVGGR